MVILIPVAFALAALAAAVGIAAARRNGIELARLMHRQDDEL